MLRNKHGISKVIRYVPQENKTFYEPLLWPTTDAPSDDEGHGDVV